MSAERLQKLLEQVHAELEATDSLDDQGRARVLDTMGDLARVLERSPGTEKPPQEESLGERLEDAARQFEAEHPRLFTALQQIADTLRGGGI